MTLQGEATGTDCATAWAGAQAMGGFIECPGPLADQCPVTCGTCTPVGNSSELKFRTHLSICSVYVIVHWQEVNYVLLFFFTIIQKWSVAWLQTNIHHIIFFNDGNIFLFCLRPRDYNHRNNFIFRYRMSRTETTSSSDVFSKVFIDVLGNICLTPRWTLARPRIVNFRGGTNKHSRTKNH